MLKGHEDIVSGLLHLLEFFIEKQTKDIEFYSFDNRIFSFQQYVYDCVCDPDEEHGPDCAMAAPNFLFKPTNFSISWFKHIGRGMTYSEDISVVEFYRIINTCIFVLLDESLKLNTEA